MRQRTPWLLLLGLVAFLRLPNLWFPVQGDDAFYLSMAQHALVDPLHPNHFKLIAQGTEVDMRGFPKPPGNAWILASVLAAVGDFREVPFHLVYAAFSLLALWAVWELALVFCSSPKWAVAIFAVVPAFVINGNSLEADIPFVAFFLAAMAFLVRADFALAAMAGGAAALIEYKAIALVPLGALYVWRNRRAWIPAWLAVLAPAFVFAAWQVFERLTTGEASAQVLTGYFQSRGLQSMSNKLRNAVALTVHAGWMVSPLLAGATFGRVDWVVAAVTALAGAWFDASPLFWLPLGFGAALVLRAVRTTADYLQAWFALFFGFALIVFFAGSARYLLPIAAPLAIVTVNQLKDRRRLLIAGFASQLALSLALNRANFDHWNAYRSAVRQVKNTLATQRSWVAADWGLGFYAESEGAAPMKGGQAVRPGDVVITSQLGQAIDYTTGGGTSAPLHEFPVRPLLPLRLMAVNSPSAYSTHAHGLRAFDVSTQPADVVSVVQILERAPQLSFLPMNAPEVSFQIASGVYALEDNSWRWTAKRVVALLKPPATPTPVQATFRIIDQSPVRHASLTIDGRVVAEETYQGSGLHTLRSVPIPARGESVTVILTFDQSFSPPQDARELSTILTGIGFIP
jgi:hypothetical protein